jgi:hypothetical protein
LRFRTARVVELLSEREGLQRVETSEGKAFVLTRLTGPVSVGDEVVVNTTAVDLGLGTGGWHVVHWNLARTEWGEPGPGHLMKLRYTSLQVDTGGAEEDGEVPGDLEETPVVACSLHSQIAGVAAALRHLRPDARVVYVMTDGAGLPLALSDLVAELRQRELILGTITAGHAFGGDLEAVTIPSALALAVHRLDADVVVVAMGPGVVGSGTSLGTTALEVTSTLHAAHAQAGWPIACVRVSDADARDRHRGVSHHTRTALGHTLVPVTVALPPSVDPAELGATHHHVRTVEVPDVAALLDDAGLRVTTMGRGPDQEPRFFEACAAAGVVAAGVLEDGPTGIR